MTTGTRVRRWDFNRNGDPEGWLVAPEARGVVMGGALWLVLGPAEPAPARIASTGYQWMGEERQNIDLVTSPADLHIPAADVSQVRLEVLNLSSLTDFFLRWRTREGGWGDGNSEPRHSRRFTLKADAKQWQQITCCLDQRWRGTIEQIAIASAQRGVRGNLWIRSVEIGAGDPEPPRYRPDVASAHVVPRVSIPGMSQAGFEDAFRALDACLVTDLPIFGFGYPVMSPGGYYSEGGWWQLDSSLALTGAQWANQRFAEDVMRGFAQVQADNPDGRIDLAGFFWVRGQVSDVSSLPKFLEVAYHVARRTHDGELRGQIFDTLRRYLDWWLSPVKRDARTGLISGIGEETFGSSIQAWHLALGREEEARGMFQQPMTLAPVDLNVEVAVGAARAAQLASALGRQEDADRYRQVFDALAEAINTHLWDEAAGAYLNYDLIGGQRVPGLNVTIFDPLRLGIAPAARRDRLLKRMLDPGAFNWGKRPLTSRAMTEPAYVEARGNYDGRAWFGDIWTLRNMAVVAGLEESGFADLAAELNWATIRTFHSNYWEYAVPSTGEGQGASSYAWTASQYIGAIVEHLFGIDYDAIAKSVRVAPHVPKELFGRDIAIENLILPTLGDTRLAVRIRQTSATAATLAMKITGPLPEGELVLSLPGTSARRHLPIPREFTAELNAAGSKI